MKYLYKIYYYFLFKIKDPEKLIKHPKYDLDITFGFTVGSTPYYRLKHDYEIFENRFRYLRTYYQEVENKLTSQDINEFADAGDKYIENYLESLHKGTPKPEYLDKAKDLNKELKYRSEWLFEPTSLFKYASVIYFDLAEDITDYDMSYNHAKIRYWAKKKTILRLFLKELMTGVETLLTLSNTDFKNYISHLQSAKDKQQKLISDVKPSSSKHKTEETI